MTNQLQRQMTAAAGLPMLQRAAAYENCARASVIIMGEMAKVIERMGGDVDGCA